MSRWETFRSLEESIPATPFEAAVFVSHARLHLLGHGHATIDARTMLNDAMDIINLDWAAIINRSWEEIDAK